MKQTDIDETEYRYEKHTWPELKKKIENDAVVLIPTASTEDHGHHLPLDVDIEIPTNICEETAKRRDDVLVFPTATQGYLPHHMDMVGGVTIKWETFIKYLVDIGVSLSHHGFEKILFINGHGSNDHLVQQAARQVIVQNPSTHAAMISWWDIHEVQQTAESILDTGPEGSSHGGESETSIYLHLHPDRVDMDKAVRDINYPENRIIYNSGLTGGKRHEDASNIKMMEWWSTVSETGTRGDPTAATPEKGEALFEAAVDGLDTIVDEYQEYPIRKIQDKHSREVSDGEYDVFRYI